MKLCCVLLALLVVSVEMTPTTVQDRFHPSLQSVQDSILLATKALSRSPASEVNIAAALDPLLSLVDQMLEQVTGDVSEMIKEEVIHFQKEQNELDALSHPLADDRDLFSTNSFKVDVLTSQKLSAQHQIEQLRVSLATLREELERSQANCLVRVPGLQTRLNRIKADKDMLLALKNRIETLVNANVPGAELGAMLSQIEQSISTSVLTHTSSFLELENAPEGSEDAAITSRISKLRTLLDRLVSELQLVMTAQETEIKNIQTACTEKDSQLTQSIASGELDLQDNQYILGNRTLEIGDVERANQVVASRIASVEQDLAKFRQETTRRMQISATLIKTQQHAQLTLTEMSKLLHKYKSTLTAATSTPSTATAVTAT